LSFGHFNLLGVENLDSKVGVYAPDAEAYKIFASLFDPIIEEYHGFGKDQKQPIVDFGDDRIAELSDLDPDGKYILSTRFYKLMRL
jgi:creatine kinase/arginine kinase